MENPIIVPFDLNTARKIKSGEIEGSVLINDIEIEFLMWVDENRQEMDAKHLDCLVPIRKLELQEYLSPEILKMEHI